MTNNSEFIFRLTTPVTYQVGGKNEQKSELILKAPSNAQRRECAKLKQGFFRAVKSIQDDKSKPETKENPKGGSQDAIDGEQVVTAIMMSDVDFCEYQETFRELILNGVAFVTESQKLTSHMYDSMSDEDSTKLMGEYVANFLLSSWMKRLESGLTTP